MVTNPAALEKARDEIDAADRAGKLSAPITYEETRLQLPYTVACIKEGLRLNPPATNFFPRVVPAGGKEIQGHYVPEGTEITSHAYTVQRDATMYGQDAEAFEPERWLGGEQRTFELDAAQFTFGVGPRVCLGKDIALMELYKLLPEVSGPDHVVRTVLIACRSFAASTWVWRRRGGMSLRVVLRIMRVSGSGWRLGDTEGVRGLRVLSSIYHTQRISASKSLELHSGQVIRVPPAMCNGLSGRFRRQPTRSISADLGGSQRKPCSEPLMCMKSEQVASLCALLNGNTEHGVADQALRCNELQRDVRQQCLEM